MKKIAALAVCALVMLAGVFVAGGGQASGKVFADGGGDPVVIPPGFQMRFSGSPEANGNLLSDGTKVNTLYNTSGYLFFSFQTAIVEASINIENVVVTRLADVYNGDENVVWDDAPEYDNETDYDRRVCYWDFNEVGVYKALVSVLVLHFHGSECYKEHECDGECELECSEEFDLDCEIPEIEQREFTFYFICNSAIAPNFIVTFTHGSEVYYSTSGGLYSDVKEGFEVKAFASNANYYFDASTATYGLVDEEDEKLTVSNDGKSLLLHTQKKGTYTLKFAVTYTYVKAGYDDVEEEWVVTAVPTTVIREESVTFADRPRPATIWDVLLGVVILGALGGAAFLASKLSKKVENR